MEQYDLDIQQALHIQEGYVPGKLYECRIRKYGYLGLMGKRGLGSRVRLNVGGEW